MQLHSGSAGSGKVAVAALGANLIVLLSVAGVAAGSTPMLPSQLFDGAAPGNSRDIAELAEGSRQFPFGVFFLSYRRAAKKRKRIFSFEIINEY